MAAGQVILVGGGCRSGKSSFGLALARRLGQRRLFVATAEPGDAEMAHRIHLHRQTRGSDFQTLEEPRELPRLLAGQTETDVIVIDCLTFWLANLLLAGQEASTILAQVEELAGLLTRPPWHAVLVTSEVGLGIVPDTALGRTFRDLAGSTHQRLAKVADEVYLAILGTILRIKPSLEFVTSGASCG